MPPSARYSNILSLGGPANKWYSYAALFKNEYPVVILTRNFSPTQWLICNNLANKDPGPQKMNVQYARICLATLVALSLTIQDGHCLGENIGPNGLSTEKRYHPVLHFSSPSELKPEKLTADTFHNLSTLYKSNDRNLYCTEDMWAGEQQACTGLNRLVKNLSQSRVQELLGAPLFTSGPLASGDDCSTDQQNWFYDMGYCSVHVRIVFEKERCVLSEICQPRQFFPVTDKVAADIEKASIGKTANEISKIVGKPLEPRQDSSNDMEITVGNDFSLEFHFTDGRCDRVTHCVILE